MYILVACEESQAVCVEFRKIGHIAFSCDIQECTGLHPEWHIVGDVLPLLNGKCSFTTQSGDFYDVPDKWDMIIAFPPCTYLSNAGNRVLYNKDGTVNQERFNKGMAAREFFLKILSADCDKIAVENPKHNTIFNIPPYSQQIQPYYFGHPCTKLTRLWLKNLPILMATDIVVPVSSFLPNSSSNDKGCCISNKSRDRSKTFPGVAAAMAQQWGTIF